MKRYLSSALILFGLFGFALPPMEAAAQGRRTAQEKYDDKMERERDRLQRNQAREAQRWENHPGQGRGLERRRTGSDVYETYDVRRGYESNAIERVSASTITQLNRIANRLGAIAEEQQRRGGSESSRRIQAIADDLSTLADQYEPRATDERVADRQYILPQALSSQIEGNTEKLRTLVRELRQHGGTEAAEAVEEVVTQLQKLTAQSGAAMREVVPQSVLNTLQSSANRLDAIAAEQQRRGGPESSRRIQAMARDLGQLAERYSDRATNERITEESRYVLPRELASGIESNNRQLKALVTELDRRGGEEAADAVDEVVTNIDRIMTEQQRRVARFENSAGADRVSQESIRRVSSAVNRLDAIAEELQRRGGSESVRRTRAVANDLKNIVSANRVALEDRRTTVHYGDSVRELNSRLHANARRLNSLAADLDEQVGPDAANAVQEVAMELEQIARVTTDRASATISDQMAETSDSVEEDNRNVFERIFGGIF